MSPAAGTGNKDKDISATIHKAVVADTTLSSAAKKVNITTVNGKVTLKGTVKTDTEKSAIESKAKNADGVTDVDNQLKVKK